MSLLKSIQLTDIILYDKDLSSKDDRKAGYNIGDLFNAPYLIGRWGQNPHVDDFQLFRMNNIAQIYPASIVGLYCNGRPADEKVPNIDRLKNTFLTYIQTNKHNFIDMYNLVQQPDVLCVHVRSGDFGEISSNYVDAIRKLSKNYKQVILFCGIHLDEYFLSHESSKRNIVNDINKIVQTSDNIFVYLDSQDVHLSLMSASSNVLVHTGGFSTVISLMCAGALFITSEFKPAFHKHWKQLNIKYTMV